jgi:hypothetical protein
MILIKNSYTMLVGIQYIQKVLKQVTIKTYWTYKNGFIISNCFVEFKFS